MWSTRLTNSRSSSWPSRACRGRRSYRARPCRRHTLCRQRGMPWSVALSDSARRDLEERGYAVVETPLHAFLRSGGSACCLTLRLDHRSSIVGADAIKPVRQAAAVNEAHSEGRISTRSKLGFVSFAVSKGPPSILRLAAIQGIKREQDLTGLAPKNCFIPAQTVKRVTGQISQTQKATCKVDGGINAYRTGWGFGFSRPFR